IAHRPPTFTLFPYTTPFRSKLNAGALVCSLVYHREPALLAAAKQKGLATLDGKSMLVYQAARAFTRMTGQIAPIEVMKRVICGVDRKSTRLNSSHQIIP